MTTARLTATAVAVLLVASGPTAWPQPSRRLPAETSPKPNVLLILTDDQRAGTLGVMPSTRAWLAERGTKYRNAFVAIPECCPSRASTFTGLYPHNHGVLGNGDAEVLDHEDTVQRHLQDAGYTTAIAGKFLNRWDLSQPPPYFNRWAIMRGRYFDADFNVDGSRQEVSGYSNTFLTTYARDVLASLENVDDTPWFLTITPFAPHAPFIAEERYATAPVGRWDGNPAVRERDRSDKPPYVQRGKVTLSDGRKIRRKQLRTLMSVDDLVDEVMETLEDSGELDDTIVIFTSDNGSLWSEHGKKGKGMPYTQAIRVPLLVSWPLRMEEGAVDRRLVVNVDLAPTVLEAAGVTVDARMDGRPLLAEARRTLLVEQFEGRGPWASLRTRRYQYVEYYGDGGGVTFREFYRLRKDPWQLTNVLRDGKKGNDPDVKELGQELKLARTCDGGGSNPCP